MTTPIYGDDNRPYVQGSGGWYEMNSADGPYSKNGTTFTLQAGGSGGGQVIEIVQTVAGLSETAVPSQVAVGTALALKADQSRVILKEGLAQTTGVEEGSEFLVMSKKAVTEALNAIPKPHTNAQLQNTTRGTPLTGFTAAGNWTKIVATDTVLSAFQKLEGGIEWALKKIEEMERENADLRTLLESKE